MPKSTIPHIILIAQGKLKIFWNDMNTTANPMIETSYLRHYLSHWELLFTIFTQGHLQIALKGREGYRMYKSI